MSIANVESLNEAVRRIDHKKFSTGPGQIHVSAELEDDIPVLSATVEGQSFRISDYAEKSLLRIVGITPKFLENAAGNVDLVEEAINTSLKGMSSERSKKIHASTMGDQMMAFAPVQARQELPPNLTEVWNVVRDLGADVIGGEVVDLGRGEFDLRVVTDHAVEPKGRVGDITNSGVLFSVNGSVNAYPFTNRLACTNGMTRMDVHAKVPFEGSIKDQFEQAVAEARAFNEAIQATDEVVLPNIYNYISQALQVSGAPAALRGQVSDLIAEEAPNNTLWEALQIITKIGRDLAADRPRKRRSYESIAGNIVHLQGEGNRCGSCNSRIGGAS